MVGTGEQKRGVLALWYRPASDVPIRAKTHTEIFWRNSVEKPKVKDRIRAMPRKTIVTSSGAAEVVPTIMTGTTVLNAPVRKRGRPAKLKEPLTEPTPRGRKMKWTKQEQQSLLRHVEQYKNGHPSARDADALRAYKIALAEKIGVHFRSPKLPSLKTLQNSLSLARQSFPEKSP